MLRVVNFGAANGGLATVGYTIYGVNGVAIGTRVTAGVVEIGTSTGIYAANVTMPGYDAIVLWDTGAASPKYSTEDYQHQIDAIAEGVELIQKIYNSIKNQGEFFALYMDKLGLIEKNTDFKQIHDKIDKLVKRDNIPLTNMEEAFKKAAKEITLTAIAPGGRDNSKQLSEIFSVISGLRGEVSAINARLLKDPQKDINKYLGDNMGNLAQEIRVLKNISSKFDDVVVKVNAIKDGAAKIEGKQEILNAVNNLNVLIRRLAMTQEDMGILQAFGHKR